EAQRADLVDDLPVEEHARHEGQPAVPGAAVELQLLLDLLLEGRRAVDVARVASGRRSAGVCDDQDGKLRRVEVGPAADDLLAPGSGVAQTQVERTDLTEPPVENSPEAGALDVRDRRADVALEAVLPRPIARLPVTRR